VFTGSPLLAKKVSLKSKRSLQFFNSGIECRLLEYELYEGSRKIKKCSKVQTNGASLNREADTRQGNER
jgi:putative N6-adenine-specific DNA methylase